MTIYKLQEVINSKYNRHDVARQAEISRVCCSISHVSIEQEIAEPPEFLKALGTANAEHVLDKIPDDSLYLNDIFK